MSLQGDPAFLVAITVPRAGQRMQRLKGAPPLDSEPMHPCFTGTGRDLLEGTHRAECPHLLCQDHSRGCWRLGGECLLTMLKRHYNHMTGPFLSLQTSAQCLAALMHMDKVFRYCTDHPRNDKSSCKAGSRLKFKVEGRCLQ